MEEFNFEFPNAVQGDYWRARGSMATYDPATQNIFGLTQFDPTKFQVDGQTQFFDLSKPLLSTVATRLCMSN